MYIIHVNDLYKHVYAENKVKLATVVKYDQKAPFSIASIPRSWVGRYSFPWIAPLYPWYVPYIAILLSKEASGTIFKVFGMTQPEIELSLQLTSHTQPFRNPFA